MIETLLNFGHSLKTSQLTTQLFMKDDNDAPEDTDPSGANNDLFERSKYISLSKCVDLQGPIYHDSNYLAVER